MPSFSHAVVFRLSALGDVALITGVLCHWQSRGMRFTVITRESLAPLFTSHPAVEEVVALTPAELKEPRRLFSALATRFAGLPLIDLHGTLRSRLLACYWRGSVFRYPKAAWQRRLFLLSRGRLCRKTLLEHNVPQRYALALDTSAPARHSLLPRIFLTDEERARARTLLASSSLSPGQAPPASPPSPLIALHPYATHEAKAWPQAHWQALCALLDEAGLPWLAVGQSPRPVALPQTGLNLSNATDLRTLCAVLECATLLVTGDSGPMHLASAVGTPTLALFGPTCEEWGFFPQGEWDMILQAPLPCRPCSLHGGACPAKHECMASLTPQAVMQALFRALSRG